MKAARKMAATNVLAVIRRKMTLIRKGLDAAKIPSLNRVLHEYRQWET